ncbi:MarR family winged helix-turn-helix transcriptional regulator [Streptacidiphilus sp. P02-A3a]|uniref:MarR family winged helix-turn-helix transcriptional regulator n=1 Tax=Streptacidiphilus sp. P02-A3a TaxID=2704468 RepID=UPI0015FC11BB|nr:MarR family transcriptional regulator [Streptacidiphilus sp. P02-A3a]QMU68897.1 MarR family transcriptional regulator [Streptacidiphilus sp. P02-A3a]
MNSSDTTTWLDDTQGHAWRSFLRMHTQLMARLGRQLQTDSDLSLADFDVLVQLTDIADGRLRVLELAKALRWEKSRLSHHLGRMVGRGLIDREDCPNDRRGSFVVITPQGREAIEAAAPTHVATVRRLVFDALTPEQVAALASVSEEVLRQLEEPPAA